ncbi:MAG: cupin domain-containing protein [Bacteroidaceae bacterium]|nr:cupin domain-containing protein [Bacteroidaceae bacterium]
MIRKVAFVVISACLFVSCISRKPELYTGMTQEQLPLPLGNKIDSPSFTGDAFIKPMITADTVLHFPQTNHLTFAPSAHSGWHRHGGMIVLVTGGEGLYQEEGKTAQILRQGDVLQIPAGVRHWHGASKDSWFSQIVIYDSSWQSVSTANYGDNTVSDIYYNELDADEYAHSLGTNSSMFAVSDSMLTFPTFSGTFRAADLLDGDNVAGVPAIHYVVFEPGVINAWHAHPDGQLIIATEGIGYHQIEGQDVEVLHPGDVAICPPGVRHWHGATPNSRFAHLAANSSPDVEWFTMLSKEEYDSLTK